MEIARSLHQYQDWLGLIYTTLIWVNTNAANEQKGVPIVWELVKKQAADLLSKHRTGSEWSINVEEYESVFPETARVRIDLLKRQRHVVEILSKLSSDLMTATFPGVPSQGRLELASWAVEQKSFVLDQQSLIGDMRVHLQNASLRRITGARVPLRTPTDSSLPMIVVGKDGLLEIVPASVANDDLKVIAKP